MFNGVSVEELERRAQPLEDRTQDPDTWWCRSSTGFLAPGERLLEVIEADAALVRRLGTSREELASLVERAVESREPSDFFVSAQTSLFFREGGSEAEKRPWRHEWRVREGDFEVVLTEATARWIREYGFFQGDTPHRADPRLLLAVLKPGADVEPARELLREKRAKERQRRVALKAQLEREWAAFPGDAEADAFFSHEIAKLALD